MSKVTALKKLSQDSKSVAGEQIKNCRLPSVEIPGAIMQAAQKLVKDKGCTMAQFWKEAAGLRLQAENIQAAKEELDRLLGQVAFAENKLREIEVKEQLLSEREIRIEEAERMQVSLVKERLAEIEKTKKELEEDHRVKLAEVEEIALQQEKEHNARLECIEDEVRERSGDYRRCPDVDCIEKEKDLIKREAQVEIKEGIALEKEKFWAAMYDAVIKLTRVCGALK